MGAGAAAEYFAQGHLFPRVAPVHGTREVGLERSAVPAQPGATPTGAFAPQLLRGRRKLAQGCVTSASPATESLPLLLSYGRSIGKALLHDPPLRLLPDASRWHTRPIKIMPGKKYFARLSTFLLSFFSTPHFRI